MNKQFKQYGIAGIFAQIAHHISLRVFLAGFAVLIMGGAFYFDYQTTSLITGDALVWQLLDSPAIKLIVLSSLPSFLHALGWGLLISSLLVASRLQIFHGHLIVLCISLGLEFLLGTYDTLDVYALLAGSALSLFIGLYSRFKRSEKREQSDYARRVIASLVAISGVFAVASYSQTPDCARFEGDTCVQEKRFAKPVYMSYSELRSGVQFEEPHALTEISRIYLYKSLMFMNERNQGIHIIDNRFPANPRPMAFVRIPGNLDISIRGDYLYADSYVDLVTLDLRDINNIQEVTRQTDIFPFDAFQNIPFDIDFEFADIDSSRGVIVGFRE